MPGARYEQWAHIQAARGDRAAAAPYVSFGRKLLGYVMEDAARQKLQSHQVTRTLDDGTLIVAEIRGGIPRIYIDPAPGRPPEIDAPPPGGFVVLARTQALPDGIDPEFPQQILREGRTPADPWRVFAHAAGLPGRADSTYNGLFPDGMTRAGNTDWTNARGERISWYGPSGRMLMDAYVQPRHMYGKFVFMMGEPLLDVDAYIAESAPDPAFDDRWIVGAALKDIGGVMWLYTMQSYAQDGETDMTPIPDGDGRYAYPLAPQFGVGGVHRYRLIAALDDNGIRRYTVVTGSHEKLMGVNLGHADPWFFNADATEMVCHSALPPVGTGNPWWSAQLFDGYNPPDDGTGSYPEDDVEEYFPGEMQLRTRLTIADDGAVTMRDQFGFSLVTGGPPAPLASDYDDTGALVSIGVGMTAGFIPYVTFDGLALPLQFTLPAGPYIHGFKRWILYSSPRDHVMVFFTEDILWIEGIEHPATATRGEGLRVEVYRNGTLVETQQVSPAAGRPLFGFVRLFEDHVQVLGSLAGHPISPAWLAYGANINVVNDNPIPFPSDPEEAENTFRENINFIGCNAAFAWLAYPGTCYFGTYDRNSPDTSPRPPTPVGDWALDGFSGAAEDLDGHHAVTGAAATKDSFALSASVPSSDGSLSVHHISRDTLPVLTGVSGPGQRYHPIWIIGKPPKE